MTPKPSPQVAARAAAVLGWRPTAWRPVSGGYTAAARYVASGRSERAFVKVATTPFTAIQLRREGHAYERLAGPFMPRFVGWDDHPDEPLLVIEDLSAGRWPPPWDAASVAAVLDALAALHATRAELPTFLETHGADLEGWGGVAADPAAFLALGLVSPAWLARALPALIEAEAACPLEGEAATHFDVRSDNLCLTEAGAKLVDWTGACLGNPDLDLGFWLPSLRFEGGPAPDDLLADAPLVAAVVSGYFAARAGLPVIPDAPFVRRVQREQLGTALPWVARALKLDPP